MRLIGWSETPLSLRDISPWRFGPLCPCGTSPLGGLDPWTPLSASASCSNLSVPVLLPTSIPNAWSISRGDISPGRGECSRDCGVAYLKGILPFQGRWPRGPEGCSTASSRLSAVGCFDVATTSLLASLRASVVRGPIDTMPAPSH